MMNSTPSLLITDPKRVTPSGSRKLAGFSKYFWLKYVTGFNSRVHCGRCLKGTYSRDVSYTMPLNVPVTLGEVWTNQWDYIYLCGVSVSGWGNNLHVAVRYVPGNVVRVSTFNGLQVTMKHVEQVEIPWIEDGFDGRSRKFTTCRNWQFGVARYGLDGSMVQGRLL